MLARRVRSHDLPTEERDRLIMRDAEGIVADTASLTSILEELLIAADVRTPVSHEPVDLAALAASAVASAQAAAHEANVTLTVSHDDTSSTVVAGTPSALARSVAALVDNAVEHAAQRVDVRVSRNRRWVVVDVVDDGPGIADETLPRMFDRFSSELRTRQGIWGAKTLRTRARTGQRNRVPSRRNRDGAEPSATANRRSPSASDTRPPVGPVLIPR